MRKGKYYRYSLKILYYLFEVNPKNHFNLTQRCGIIADKLLIPKTSFFDTLKILEDEGFIIIVRATKDVEGYFVFGNYFVEVFESIRITNKGIKFYLKEFEHNSLTRT